MASRAEIRKLHIEICEHPKHVLQDEKRCYDETVVVKRVANAFLHNLIIAERNYLFAAIRIAYEEIARGNNRAYTLNDFIAKIDRV